MRRFARSSPWWPAIGGFALCAVILGGCGDGDGSPGAAAGGSELVGTRWALDVSALGVPDAGSVSSWLAFARGGRVSGNDGCNSFSGSYEVDGSKLTFGPLAGTKMACTGLAGEVSHKVTAALPRVRGYARAADRLDLEDAGGKPLLRYAASAPGVEGKWTVISLLYDDAIRSAVADVNPTAEFSADGKISGTTGCNSFHGDYVLKGETLNVGPLTATKKSCPTPETSAQEAGYLSALESAVRIEQAGRELTLLNAKGQKAVTLTR